MHALTTDSGSGSTGDGLARDLRVLARLFPILSFIGVTYGLHRHSLSLKSPVEK